MLITIHSYGQKPFVGKIEGIIADSVNHEVLAGGTVLVVNSNDASVNTYAITDKKGRFQINDIHAGNYRLNISFQGYETVSKSFTISNKNTILAFDTILLKRHIRILDEVVVQSSPILVNNDTTEFKAWGFVTTPNAMAEELLQKLPGTLLDRNGNIKFQGETITKIYVNGKEFFGGDPSLAMKNIPADMIESIQVYDDKTEASKWSGTEDDITVKVINIKLKKDKKTGHFGKATAGIGTVNRYLGSTNLNYYKDNQQLSFIGNVNNINSTIYNDQNNNTNDRGTAGITNSTYAGMNYSNTFSDKLQLTGSYLYDHKENKTETSGTTQSFFQSDSVSVSNNNGIANNNISNQRFNVKMEYTPDSNNAFSFMPDVTVSNTAYRNNNEVYVNNTTPEKSILINKSNFNNTTSSNGYLLNNRFLYLHKFKKFKRSMAVSYQGFVNNSNYTNYIQSSLLFFNADETVRTNLQQHFKNNNAQLVNNNKIDIVYTEPIDNNKTLEFSYDYTFNHATSNRKAFDYDSATDNYNIADALQTNVSDNTVKAGKYGIQFKWDNKNFDFHAGASVEQSALFTTNVKPSVNQPVKDSAASYHQQVWNFYPSAYIRYKFTKTKILWLSFAGHTMQPAILQLQNVPVFTNPLYIHIGNPYLKPAFINNFSLGYNSYNTSKELFFSVNAGGSFTQHEIVNSIDSVPNTIIQSSSNSHIQLTMPVNTNGGFNTYYDVNVSMPLHFLKKGSSLSLSNDVYVYRNVLPIYKLKNYTTASNISQTVVAHLLITDKLNFDASATITYNSIKNSVNNDENVRSWYQNYMGNLVYFVKDNLQLTTTFNYVTNTGLSTNYNSAIPLWKLSAAFQCLKNKKGEVKLECFDVLNKNKSIERSIYENNITDFQKNVLKRYFLLKFTYSINKYK